MNSKIKKSAALLVSAAMLSSALVGCGGTKTDSPSTSGGTAETSKKPDGKKKLTFWHFQQAESPKIEAAFEKAFPDIDLVVSVTNTENQVYQTKLALAIQSGNGVPDIYPGESAFVKRFVDMPNGWLDITDKAKEITGNQVPYTVDVGTDKDGKIRALSHQATPGGIGYKRTLAKKYLGTDDPAEVSKMLSSADEIVKTAEKLNTASAGKASLFAGYWELKKIYFGGRSNGWVKDGKLFIDPKVGEMVDLVMKLKEKKLDPNIEQWKQPWADAIKAEESAMCYSIPTWGIPYIIKAKDEQADKNNKWGIASSPFPYFWGGTWYGIYSKSPNVDDSWNFIKWFTGDQAQLTAWSKDTGDFANNTKVIADSITANEINPIIQQNVYKVFEPSLKSINGKILTDIDDIVEQAFDDNFKSYWAGTIKTKDDFMKAWKEKLKTNLKGKVTVE